MPAHRPELKNDDVAALVREQCFAPSDVDRIGVELEWLTVDERDATHAPSPTRTRAALRSAGALVDDVLPAGSRLTFEPGGQLELSSPPATTVADACRTAADDLATARAALRASGLRLVGLGLDPVRPCHRLLDAPRYRAMQEYFDRLGDTGRSMMCRTAAVQVNLGAGHGEQVHRRWHLAHTLGPAFAAAFANSPLDEGMPSGWRSSRLAVWLALDRGRTAPVDDGGHPADAWTRFVLEARVMLIRADAHTYVPLDRDLTFAAWMRDGHELGYPTVDDLEYHLTTLFPPVRAKGWLELRMIDALPDPWWRVPVAVTSALLLDDEASSRAGRVGHGVAGLWTEAARHGMAFPALADGARACFALALDALPRVGADTETCDLVAAYNDRYVIHGRSPADDRLEEWAEGGDPLSPDPGVPEWASR
ncbi:MAG TPA: ergothioneine biosynthesis glutamate--cysteine ligase EgtA [Acidimicrobiales bacterium]|nr:ergothioneine biosynthesis glutamate--cysteine ligase EgtA [Acidimicrobiales bacterium]